MLIVGAIFVIAVVLWLWIRYVPVWGWLVTTIVVLPIVEEVLFRWLLTGVWGLRYGGVTFTADLIGRLVPFERKSEYVMALVFFGVIFGVAHLVIGLLPSGGGVLGIGSGIGRSIGGVIGGGVGRSLLDPTAVFRCPPGLQLCEGLFIGLFNGCIYLIFIYLYDIPLLATMLYIWLAHMLINSVIVAYNVVVNVVFGRSLLAHIAPRLALACVAVFWFVKCWATNSLPTDIFN